VLYVLWICQWCSILHSQANAFGAADLGHSEGTFPTGGELVHSLTGKNAPKHQIVHLELPTTHEPLVIAPERLTVPCVSKSCLPSLLVDEVDIIMPKLVLRGFVLCLDTGEDHDDFGGGGGNGLCSVLQKERRLPRGPTQRCPVGPRCARKLINPLGTMLF
jgi:hypothetical protein